MGVINGWPSHLRDPRNPFPLVSFHASQFLPSVIATEIASAQTYPRCLLSHLVFLFLAIDSAPKMTCVAS